MFYCDVVIGDLNTNLKRRLQRIFNSCIRYIYNLKKYDRLTPYYNTIFNCPLENYFKIRLLIFIFKIIRSRTPVYLYENLQFSVSNRTNNIDIPAHLTNIMGNSFIVRAARVWNSLPSELKLINNVGPFRRRILEYFNDL